MYEGIFQSSWFELVTKYSVPTVIGNCCPFQISPISWLCSGSGITTTAGRTAGADFLKFHVRVSMIVAELQECPENDVLIAVILFLETRKISRSHIR
jgi:hypothetical protein